MSLYGAQPELGAVYRPSTAQAGVQAAGLSQDGAAPAPNDALAAHTLSIPEAAQPLAAFGPASAAQPAILVSPAAAPEPASPQIGPPASALAPFFSPLTVSPLAADSAQAVDRPTFAAAGPAAVQATAAEPPAAVLAQPQALALPLVAAPPEPSASPDQVTTILGPAGALADAAKAGPVMPEAVVALPEAVAGPLVSIAPALGDGLTDGVQDLLGSDPAGGIATLVSLVTITDVFDLDQAGADPPDPATPSVGLIDLLADEPDDPPLPTDLEDEDSDTSESPLPGVVPADPPAGDIPIPDPFDPFGL